MTPTDQIQVVLNRAEAKALLGAATLGISLLENSVLVQAMAAMDRELYTSAVCQLLGIDGLTGLLLFYAQPEMDRLRALNDATNSVRTTLGTILKATNPNETTDFKVPPSPFRKRT